MLYSVDTGNYIKKLPHKKDFDRWLRNLNNNDYSKICDKLNDQINSSEINTSSWIPGNDWTGTVYDPIYQACGRNQDSAAMFFGLILFKLLMDRQDAVWGFGKYEKNGVPIKGTTYFILHNHPLCK